MERVDVARMHVQPVEKRLLFPVSCSASNSGGSRNRSVLRPLTDRKSPTVCDPPPTLASNEGRLERAVAERQGAGRLRLVEARLGHDVHDQAALVAVLRRRARR